MRLVLTDQEFAQLCRLLARAAGLLFDEARRDSVAVSVAARLQATGTSTVADYLTLLDGEAERQRLLDEVTIQETYFFRNPPQVQALRTHVLPDLVRSARDDGRRRLRVWSAGCSTGEEPYTVAMLLRELLPPPGDWDVQVLGTDVSQRALAAARAARYGPRAVHLASPSDLARHFTDGPDGTHDVRPEVRSMVTLRHHNLVTDPPPAGPDELDLVLCRNVTIYFDRAATRALVARLQGVLRVGGYLVLGHAETLWQVSDAFRLVQVGEGDGAAFVYQLPERRTAPRREPPPLWRGPERRVAPVLWQGPERRAAVDPADPVRAALAAGRYAEAARLAAVALLAEPLRADLHYLHGLALVDLGRDVEAAVVLRRAGYLAPQDGLVHFLLAGVLARLGDGEAARREYAAAARSLTDAPPDPAAGELGGRSSQELALLCRRLADPHPHPHPNIR